MRIYSRTPKATTISKANIEAAYASDDGTDHGADRGRYERARIEAFRPRKRITNRAPKQKAA